MLTVLKVCGGAVIALVSVLVLRTWDKSGGMTGAVVLCASFGLVGGAMALLLPLFARVGALCTPYLSDTHRGILWRAMGVAVVLQITTDLIRDAGETTIADRVELYGRAVLLAMGFPLVEELFSAAVLLVGGQ